MAGSLLSCPNSKSCVYVCQDWRNSRPLKAEFYPLSNQLMKTCSYENYSEMAGKRRPTRLVMEDALRRGAIGAGLREHEASRSARQGVSQGLPEEAA